MDDPLLVRGEIDDAGGDRSTFLLPTGTVTFLLTDVEGSTQRWEAAPEPMAKAIDRHYEILADVIGRHRGVRPVEQGEGDSVVAAFSRATDAVAAALEAQQRLADEAWPEGAVLAVRMALHTGDAQLRDAFNYFGPVVIRCARLRALAHGAQVLATGALHDVVGANMPTGADWRDLGDHRLKDLSRPEHIYQLVHPSLRDDFPPLRSLDATSNNLPAQVSSFIGRERELSAVGELLTEHRLVTLTGPGGCGKTRLALQTAAEQIDRHPGGVWYVELAALRESGTVDAQIAATVGAVEEPGASTVDLITERLGTEPTLLVLDNCEHLLDGVAPIAAALLSACAELRILATSRQPLDLRGEVTWRVPSMALPDPSVATTIDQIGGFDAVRLFVDRACRSRSDFALGDANAPAVGRICQRLDGIPLAIELAAARVRQMGVDDIERGLEDRFRLLAGRGRTLLPRQQTLAASVDWSHDLLDPDEQVAFRRLAVFSGGFSADAAAAVLDDPLAAVVLGDLVDRSLLQLDDQPTGTRYRFLETVKAYARDRLRAADETDATAERHLAYHVDLAERSEAEIRTREDKVWLVDLDRSHDDMRAALRRAADTADVDALARLVVALGAYWHARGQGTSAQSWYEEALRVTTDPVLRGRAAWASAYIAFYANDLELAVERATLALELAEPNDDHQTIGRACDTLASIQQYGDPAGAEPLFLRAVELARVSGDQWCETDALQKLGYSGMYRDRWDEAVLYGDQAKALAVELGNPFFLAWAGVIDGMHALRRGDLDEAEVELAEAVVQADEVGEPLTIGCAGTMLAAVHLYRGDDARAEIALEATVVRLGDGDHGLGDGMVATISGMLANHRRDPSTAAAYLGAVHAELLAMGVLYPTAFFAPELAEAHVAAGELDAARQVLAGLEGIDDLLQSRHCPAAVQLTRARIERAAGRPDLAQTAARAGFVELVELGFGPDATTALEVLAGTLGDLGNHTDCVRMLAAAATVRSDHGWRGRRSAALDAQVEADLDQARRELGDARFEEARTEGATLDLAGAAELATRSRGSRQRPSTGWASLTPTELAVADQVAAGLTNPEIAAALLMSRATVKTHVSHVLAKLGLHSRAEIAAEVTKHR